MNTQLETHNLGGGRTAIVLVQVTNNVKGSSGCVVAKVQKSPIAIAVSTSEGLRAWSFGLPEDVLQREIQRHLSVENHD